MQITVINTTYHNCLRKYLMMESTDNTHSAKTNRQNLYCSKQQLPWSVQFVSSMCVHFHQHSNYSEANIQHSVSDGHYKKWREDKQKSKYSSPITISASQTFWKIVPMRNRQGHLFIIINPSL